MLNVKTNLDFSEAVSYHTGAFPPELNYERILPEIAAASIAIGRYDGVLRGLPNSELLLAPLRRTEAVISSRMEGTVTTLDEVLRFEADEDQDQKKPFRSEVLEVISYARAMNAAQEFVEDGYDINQWLIRQMHERLLMFGRGSDKSPGSFKREQNYIIDRNGRKVLFIPIAPEHLSGGFDQLDRFMRRTDVHPLIQIGLAHLEFEALHPFKDGNGRVGRMLITLYLWNRRILSAPHFYISEYFDQHREEYIDLMRNASSNNDWEEWLLFFADAVRQQSEANIEKAEQINELYEKMKREFMIATGSRFATMALDFIFRKPVFRNNQFVSLSGIPKSTAQRFAWRLAEADLLIQLEPGSGRRSALYAFAPLIELTQP